MADVDHIFVKTDTRPADVAPLLGELLGMDVTHANSGKVYLSRPAPGGGPGEVGGEVYENRFAYPFDEPEEESVIDGYPVVFDVIHTLKDPEVQLSEAKRIFEELTRKAVWPVVLLQGLDLLVAAWTPELGVTWFPDRVTPDASDRSRWLPYR